MYYPQFAHLFNRAYSPLVKKPGAYAHARDLYVSRLIESLRIADPLKLAERLTELAEWGYSARAWDSDERGELADLSLALENLSGEAQKSSRSWRILTEGLLRLRLNVSTQPRVSSHLGEHKAKDLVCFLLLEAISFK